MQLVNIDKKTYRSRLNVVIVGCIVSLAMASLAISQTLILLFPSDTGSHFHWNLLGVVASALMLGLSLVKLKAHPFMFEVAYVWDLKQSLNLIYRKNRKLLAAAKQGNEDALLALKFNYAASRQLWELDDNTITLESLTKSESQLELWLQEFNFQPNISNYHKGLLQAF
ncbi:DUF3087 domain-containing protein [Vibrio genomosp. F10]|uniref:Medium chain reductase/dehydrogenase n=2 Tax=Vibrio genomosp. F10 TaxID=723171 RepID=A0A1B9R1L6_9VIBR|nr:DUF3087 domain-containing protein [Vibrio genomosp. F10]OCH78081.1 hypothetical protein A6E14_06205 [Vibrio genomosp. F10]OEE37122.1 hypothetical protein A1QO_04480 [Vibrio genomosp. F10 str. ZF-129]OEE83069.1 hypothetical protein A1QK_20445 [Vibrio genomosp. F10 str. 9ZD137]OEE94112.1 hypothetical protein A1QM_01055 [Vibrio genomosp. F10 str. 9ZC157]OEF07743.1 hypothetical protein A1QI_16985 [Vibrio genomosp. F10 str. 9ZB36]